MGSAAAHTDHAQKQAEAVVLAPGYQALQFPAPTPGTYRLPPLGHAADGTILTEKGDSTTLHALMRGQISVLSFIYTQCDDVNGCPLATYVLSKIGQKIAEDPELDSKVSLISVSFDRKNDTPATLAEYAQSFRDADSTWHFAVPDSNAMLEQVLEKYNQSIVVEPGGDAISHILRVYLVDREQRIRNVYSVSFLHADTVVSDIKTVAAEYQSRDFQPEVAAHESKPATTGAVPIAAGDYRDGYERGDFETRSQSLTGVGTSTVDLAAYARSAQLGLPSRPVGVDRWPSGTEISLGKRLFFDRRLSRNQTISCAMCHIPEQGFTSNELSTAVGIEGRTVRRNSPSLLNVAFLTRLFHDGRENRLEQQVWAPLLAFNEMANPSIAYVIDKISADPEYRDAFAQAFPERGITMETIGSAFAAYERALIAGDSPVDRLLYGAETADPDPVLQRGLALFTGKARCSQCHTISTDHAVFTDNQLHNTGIGYARSMGRAPLFRDVIVAPGETLEVHRDDIGPNDLDNFNDLGLYEITERPADRWKFKTPSLRNVALTAPYMHNGSLRTLREVVEFYNAGGVANPQLDPLIQPLGLSETEVDDLVYLLEGLTSDHVSTLASDARATPIGERDSRP